jgi:hypothetical protein
VAEWVGGVLWCFLDWIVNWGLTYFNKCFASWLVLSWLVRLISYIGSLVVFEDGILGWLWIYWVLDYALCFECISMLVGIAEYRYFGNYHMYLDYDSYYLCVGLTGYVKANGWFFRVECSSVSLLVTMVFGDWFDCVFYCKRLCLVVDKLILMF